MASGTQSYGDLCDILVEKTTALQQATHNRYGVLKIHDLANSVKEIQAIIQARKKADFLVAAKPACLSAENQ